MPGGGSIGRWASAGSIVSEMVDGKIGARTSSSVLKGIGIGVPGVLSSGTTVTLLALLDWGRILVDLMFILWACWWPLIVAAECGGNFRTCAEVNSGHVVRYLASIALHQVASGGENIAAWKNWRIRSLSDGGLMAALATKLFRQLTE